MIVISNDFKSFFDVANVVLWRYRSREAGECVNTCAGCGEEYLTVEEAEALDELCASRKENYEF